MKKWNKKGSLGIILITVAMMIGWIFIWIGVDFATALGDNIINRTVGSEGSSIPYNWSGQWSVFQTNRTNMNRIIFFMGLILIPLGGAGASMRQKVQDLRLMR